MARPGETLSEEDKAESAKVTEAAKMLGEHFDAVVILCSRHDGAKGTRTVCKGSGNWHTQQGLVREWLTSCDEEMRISARSES